MLNPLGQEEKVCDIKPSAAICTPLHWLHPRIQPSALSMPWRRKQYRYKEEKAPSVGLSDDIQKDRGREERN